MRDYLDSLTKQHLPSRRNVDIFLHVVRGQWSQADVATKFGVSRQRIAGILKQLRTFTARHLPAGFEDLDVGDEATMLLMAIRAEKRRLQYLEECAARSGDPNSGPARQPYGAARSGGRFTDEGPFDGAQSETDEFELPDAVVDDIITEAVAKIVAPRIAPFRAYLCTDDEGGKYLSPEAKAPREVFVADSVLSDPDLSNLVFDIAKQVIDETIAYLGSPESGERVDGEMGAMDEPACAV